MQQLDLLTGGVSPSPESKAPVEDPVSYVRSLEIIPVGLSIVQQEFTTQGPNYKSLCPFHEERTPSFFLKPAKNFYICYGCYEIGSPLNLIYRLDQPQFEEILACGGIDENDVRQWWKVESDKRDLAELIWRELERYQ